MSIPDLKVALIQTSLFWKNKTANLAMLEEKIFNLQQPLDIIVLPEMFTTGFTMDAVEVAEPMNLTTTKWMKQMAAQTRAVICGSIVISDAGNFYNRFLWVEPDGKIFTYDKRHLFRMANEEQHYAPGQATIIISYKGWKILPQICYDLRFPVWSRNTMEGDMLAYDLILFVASWPKPRISAWDILLQARAIENLCYSLGVNRVGQDGNAIPYSGHSAVYDFKGNTLVFNEDEDCVLYSTLGYKPLMEYRAKFPAWMDADNFTIP
ncbi:amidohydrolase [Mongoliitalea daihaiensis]|uniref:amidohydrolase n=1 Tax=Mongoliitalea daihaiensis TaxID=2782006 RepID=UPI001F1993CF|nr:amidohydrolase [Mongoliitalea daihaiensis]UJP64960.1 amidohydrolase [Mongoliitalea daihaiensis]